MQDYRRRHFDEDDRRERWEGGRQRGESDRSWRDQGDGGYSSPRRSEGYGPHDSDESMYAGHSEGWRGGEERHRGWRGEREDEHWSGRGGQRDYGPYGSEPYGYQGGPRQSAPGRGSAGGWGGEWGGYSGGRSGGDWSGGSYGGGRGWSSYGGRGEWSARGGMGMGGSELGGQGWRGYGEVGPQSRGGWSGESYAGRGPKDYHRSDERIREEVSDRLTDDDRIDASEITVQVKDGEVTLSGTVDDRDQKRRAEDVAESVSGVNDVTNNIRVSRDRNRGRGTTQAASAMGRGKSSAG